MPLHSFSWAGVEGRRETGGVGVVAMADLPERPDEVCLPRSADRRCDGWAVRGGLKSDAAR